MLAALINRLHCVRMRLKPFCMANHAKLAVAFIVTRPGGQDDRGNGNEFRPGKVSEPSASHYKLIERADLDDPGRMTMQRDWRAY